MWHCRQGVHNFLRAYFHDKSDDWEQNRPHRLASWSAAELAKMPTYYIMDLADDMATTVAKEMPSANEIAACKWLPDGELAVYAAEYQRNGFQGRAKLVLGLAPAALSTTSFSCFAIALSTCRRCSLRARVTGAFISEPGALERMQESACTKMARLQLTRGRRTLGSAGTARSGQFIADRFFCADPPRLKILSALACDV